MPRRGMKPPPVIKVKAPVIDDQGLRDIYDWIGENRSLTLRTAARWYSDNAPKLLFGNPLDLPRQKWFDRASAAFKLAEGTVGDNYAAEREQGFRSAVRFYEKAFPAHFDATAKIQLPAVDAAEAAIGTAVPSKRVQMARKALEMLSAAFGVLGLSFGISFDGERRMERNEVLIPTSELMVIGAKPPLAAVLEEVPTMATVLAIEEAPDGSATLDAGKLMERLPEVTQAASQWAMSQSSAKGALFAGTKLPKVKVAAPPTPKTTSAPPTPATPKTGKMTILVTDPFGIFRSNTAKAAIASFLYSAKTTTMDDLKAECSNYGVGTGMIHHVVNGINKLSARYAVRVAKNGMVYVEIK